MNDNDLRWQQRLQNFTKAISQLEDACQLETYTDLERAGLVQIFEFTFELAWKTLKDLLQYEGYEEKSPRSVMRRSFEVGYLTEDETETFLDGLQKRNLLTHTYEEKTAEEAVELINNNYYPALKSLWTKLTEIKNK